MRFFLKPRSSKIAIGIRRLGVRRAVGDDAVALANSIEDTEDGIKEGVDVLLEETSNVVVRLGDVVPDQIVVSGAEEGSAAVTHRVRLDDVVAVRVVVSRADRVSAADISGGVGEDGKSGGRSATEPVRSKGLVTEDRAERIGRELGGGAVGEELEDESDLREGSEHSAHVELERLVFLLILVEAVELELLENFVVDDVVVACVGAAVSESANVVEHFVEEVVLEVDAVTDVDVLTRDGDVTLESAVHGDTSSDGTVKLARNGWNVGSGVTDRDPTDVGISTSKSGKADDKGSEVMLDVETFHHTTVDLFNSC